MATITEITEAVTGLISNTTELTGLLPGGIHQQEEISRQETPAAFDADLELQPCLLIKTAVYPLPRPHKRAARLIFSFYVYQRDGIGTINQVLDQLYALLHDNSDDICGAWQIRQGSEVRDQKEPALESSMGMATYEAIANQEPAAHP